MPELGKRQQKWNLAFGIGTCLIVASGVISRIYRGSESGHETLYWIGQISAVTLLFIVSWWCVTHLGVIQGKFLAFMYAGYCSASAISAATAGELTGAVITFVAIFVVSPIFLTNARLNETANNAIDE